MKVVVFGLGVSSAWGNGHATLWRGLLGALARDGHDATFYERDVPYYARTRDLAAGSGWDLVLYPSWAEIEERARRDLGAADAAIVTSYCPDAQAASDLVLAARTTRVYYDLDTPVTLEALARGDEVAYLPRQGLGGFDLVLSYTGGAALEALRTTLGARRVAPLFGSVDLRVHAPAPPSGAFAGCDLSYLGTYAADRQAGVEALFLEVARRMPAHRFALGGPMYPDDVARPANVAWRPHVAPGDHPAFYGSSRVTLNVTRRSMAALGHCPSARLFEAAACGVPLVSDAWEGLDRFFEPGHEILVARSTDDVVEALRRDPEDLRAIADQASRRTREEHTAERRARELVALLGS